MKCSQLRRCIVAALLSLACVGTAMSQAPRYKFTRVVDENTVSSAGRVEAHFEPSLEAGRVVFLASDDEGEAIYSAAAGQTPTRVVNAADLVPATPVFPHFSLQQSLDGDRVAFHFRAFLEAGDDIDGIYVFQNGHVQRIVGTRTPIPFGTGGFTRLWAPNTGPSADAGQVAFWGWGEDGQSGVYLATDNEISRIVDRRTQVPISNLTFDDFDVVLDSGKLAILGYLDDGNRGLYLHDLANTNFSVVADANTLLPGGDRGAFQVIGGESDEYQLMAIDQVGVAFVGGEDYGSGVYRYDIASGTIAAVAEVGNLVPGTDVELFEQYFQTVSADGGHVAFRYGALVRQRDEVPFLTPNYGVYSDLGGSLQKVLAMGDVLDGNTVLTAHIGTEALHGKQIAMLVTFQDASQAIYLATLVPEPTSVALVVVVAVFGVFASGSRNVASQRFGSYLLTISSVTLLYGAATAEAQSSRYKYTRVVQEGVILPDGAAVFAFFEPSLAASRVVFTASDDHGDGIYQAVPEGEVRRLVGTQSLVPSTTANFEWFALSQSIDGARVAFNAVAFPEEGDVIQGIYAIENGEITRVADLQTPQPSSGGNFVTLWNPNERPSANNGQVLFWGEGEETGIYLATAGELQRVLDSSMTIPNSDRAFGDFFSPVLKGGRVAFLASSDAGAGIYLHDLATGELTVVADQNTPVPENVDSFHFGGGESAIVALDNKVVAFVGGVLPGPPPPKGATGVYRHDIASGVITAVADVGTNVPGTADGQFDEYFKTVSAHGGHIAFRYGDFIRTRGGDFFTPYYGVYSDLGGSLQKVLAQGDLLDGHTVVTAHIGTEALHGKQIAMLVTFEDSVRAIYLATLVPEPHAAAIAVMLILAASWWAVSTRNTACIER